MSRPARTPTTLDLGGLTTDPDPEDADRIEYTIVGGAPDGMTASIEDDELRVSAAAETKKGTAATIRLRIDDGTTEPVEGAVTVRVIASTRDLPMANDDIVPEAHQGKTVTVPVLGNDVNPFPDKPLKVTTAILETGQGDVEVAGDEVRVTPDAKFFGTMVVRYRVQDATGDPDREVDGRIRLTVQGKPDAPGTPTVSSVQDRTVVLSWTPPANNGAEIERYLVSSIAGDYEKECLATTCTLDGLTNNVKYNFTVVAENRVGPSDPSAPSEEARPDARPDTPAAPTLTFGDKSLNVAWVTPSTPGSPVQHYTLEISPAPPSGITPEDRCHGQLDRVGRAAERRRVPGARAGAQPRTRPVEPEPVVGDRDPREGARRAGGPDDRSSRTGRLAGADPRLVEQAGRQRRRDRRLSARRDAGIQRRPHDSRLGERDQPGGRRQHVDDGLHVPGARRRTRPGGVRTAPPPPRSAGSRRRARRRTCRPRHRAATARSRCRTARPPATARARAS